MIGAAAPDVSTPTGAVLGLIVVTLFRVELRLHALEKERGGK